MSGTTTMTRDEWIDRCAKRYVERGGVPNGTAMDCAIHQYNEMLDLDIKTTPEDAADEDMSYWASDEAA